MIVKVLGRGCPNCKKVEALTRDALQELGLEATVEKVTDFAEIMQYPILGTPGLVINEQVVSSGRIPRQEEIKGWLQAAQANEC